MLFFPYSSLKFFLIRPPGAPFCSVRRPLHTGSPVCSLFRLPRSAASQRQAAAPHPLCPAYNTHRIARNLMKDRKITHQNRLAVGQRLDHRHTEALRPAREQKGAACGIHPVLFLRLQIALVTDTVRLFLALPSSVSIISDRIFPARYSFFVPAVLPIVHIRFQQKIGSLPLFQIADIQKISLVTDRQFGISSVMI